ncbi:MAG: cytochrome c biogenesis protein ResB [Desulfobulbaceae bacterium]|nr:cytochrome c biogenesis protein ResB [Desulfobulbaceae bacterium]
MKKTKNPIVQFFASVQLTLFTFIALATSSIIGTIIQQNKEPGFYIAQYGPKLAQLFDLLNIDDMYNSSWFLSLLVLLSLNLIVCTIDRLPNVWRMVVLDNLQTTPERLERQSRRQEFLVSNAHEGAVSEAKAVLGTFGSGIQQSDGEEGTLLFSQKGAWTRLGVYVVHASVLIIFVGAIIGSIYGHKGGVTLPEGSTISAIFEYGTGRMIDLGFSVRCDKFTLSYYDNGAPKEYRSDLTVIEDGKEVLTKAIVVNDPLDYRGYTFYQASYEPRNEMMVTVVNETSGVEKSFNVVPRREVSWPNEGLSFGIVNIQGSQQTGYGYKIWFSDNHGEPASLWLIEDQPGKVKRDSATYSISLRRRYATGLQIAKDPGVWYVYIGCLAMLLGLLVAFFLSHRRVWIYIAKQGDATRILLSGTANKDRIGFEKEFTGLVEKIRQNEGLTPTKEKS